ncbi:hypothetical protein FUA23_14485 [Neolewinella aurantiaca]|uniref:Cobalamin biosynthesis protein CbiG n=1 Tax=Neolewinella aurantiaca TaxID=2602767 RepID=A0A5C7FUK5_9BACT|nr:hypothetical protein [Neolewinella aurantiaca]TXF88490.1 hypothetical protein FUA23_14485 [Neolewinella aurantiaca]
MQPFDYFIIVDWSSRAKPSPVKPTKDAIWVGEGKNQGRVTSRYFRTRDAAVDYIEKKLVRLVKNKKRVLVGWDFVFGYPKGLGPALRISKKRPWKGIWKLLEKLIIDKSDNDNNRFAVGAELNRRISLGSGPFWGVPTGQSGIFLGAKRDFSYPVVNKRSVLEERRLVEERVPKMQPGWKLAYAGSVGSQALLGIPRLYRLAFKNKSLKSKSVIWPFQTRFGKAMPKGACVVHAEVYPSMIPLKGKHTIPDRAQVRAYVQWLQDEQKTDSLESWLAGPQDLSKKKRKKVLRHEGWVLGVS